MLARQFIRNSRNYVLQTNILTNNFKNLSTSISLEDTPKIYKKIENLELQQV